MGPIAPDARFEAARTRLRDGRAAEALGLLDDFLKDQPGYLPALATRGSALLALGRQDEAEAAWSVIDPIEMAWKNSKTRPFEYAPGTWGPQKAMDLIELDGRRWTYAKATESPIIACAV